MNIDEIYKYAITWIITKGPSVLLGILLLVVGMWIIKLISKALHSNMHQKGLDPSLKPFLQSLLVTALRILLIFAVMQVVGIEMTVFAAILGALGVAAGLALSGTLQNFASGIIILFLKPFSVGDNIIAQGHEGTVTAIKIFYTVVTTFDNRTVIVPNSKLSNEVIVNISSMGSRRMDIELKFSNAIDFEEVKRFVNEAIDQSEKALQKPERRIGISSIEPDGYKVMVNLWLDAHGFIDTKMEIQQKIMEKLKGSGIKLPGM